MGKVVAIASGNDAQCRTFSVGQRCFHDTIDGIIQGGVTTDNQYFRIRIFGHDGGKTFNVG